jgi:hypothetical protein
MNVGDKLFLFCTRCEAGRDHTVLFTDKRDETQEDPTGMWGLDHEIDRAFTECSVCSWPKIHLRVWTIQQEDETKLSIPPEPTRPLPDWAARLPADIRAVLKEVLNALTERQYWLVAGGCRTLIDMFALERVGDVGGFAAKLKRLQAEGYLSPHDVLLIEQAVQVGHGATHRRQQPTRAEILAVVEITEHLLQRLALDQRAETLGAAAASRKRTTGDP